MDPEFPDDIAEFLRRASTGDQEAWRSIVNCYGPRVFGLLRVQCGDPELAEELTQSTFCTVASKISDGYQESGRFEAWLFRIAMNRLRDEMRRRKRHARPTSSEVMALLDDASAPEEPLFDDGDRQALGRQLQNGRIY